MNNQNIHTHFASEIVQRLKDLTQSRRDSHLANALNVQPTTLSTWKARNSIDYRLIINFCQERGYDLNYVILGKKNVLEKNSQIEDFAEELVKEVKQELKKEFQEIRGYQNELHEQLERIKTKEEIARAKEKIKDLEKSQKKD